MLRARCLAFAVLALVGFAALAAPPPDWPTRTVRFIMPFDTGSSADAVARAIARHLSLKWGEPVVVENRPGAGTVIGTDHIAKAAPDGYTFGWATTALAINPSLHGKLPYDAAADLAGVTLIYQLKTVIVVTPGLPVTTVAELVRWARENKEQVAYTSPGVGTSPHLIAEIFSQRHNLEMRHVAYKNLGQANLDVISGRVPVMFTTLPSSIALVDSGQFRLLAVVSEEPVAGRSDLPTLSGLLPRDARAGWNGIVVPARTPRRIVKRLNADIVNAIRTPEVQSLLARMNVEPMTSTPEELDALLRAEIPRWEGVIRRAGIRLERH
jgi:tripartite-type tricarboxylate transporter receptor subunit TctC